MTFSLFQTCYTPRFICYHFCFRPPKLLEIIVSFCLCSSRVFKMCLELQKKNGKNQQDCTSCCLVPRARMCIEVATVADSIPLVLDFQFYHLFFIFHFMPRVHKIYSNNFNFGICPTYSNDYFTIRFPTYYHSPT